MDQLLAQVAQNPELPKGLNTGGWIMLIGCVGFVCSLVAFCFYHVLSESKPSARHHAPLDIDTRDRDD